MRFLVSIIISAFNSEKYLAQTLESVLAQTWKEKEIIVVNDGSSDATLAIAKSFKDRGIKVLSQENKGQDAAFNFGFASASGTYIKFMDSDDLLNREMIEIQMKTLNGSFDHVAYGEWARFYKDQPDQADFTMLDYWQDMKPLDFLTARPEGVMLQCGIMLMPRTIIEKAGLWNEQLILYNDTEFYTRILLASQGVKFSRGARMYYRSALAGSISAGRTRKYFESTFLATQLMAKHLLEIEDSVRIRRLVSNTFLSQYYRMYPEFPDLAKAHKAEIALYGQGTLKADGGSTFKILSKLFGWKFATRMQQFSYRLGYKPIHPGLKK